MRDEIFEYSEGKMRSIARCSECESLIYEDNEDIYIDEYGHYFCIP